jgi:phosphoribosyl 1,2-cyclic phosphate phosphodiesterase
VAKSFITADVSGQLIFLGTGTSIGVPVVGCGCPVCTSIDPRNNRMRCSLVLGLPEGTLLVDTTPDLRAQLLREKIGVVHSVLYTHDHADHVFGLDDVRLFPYYLGHSLPVYCEEQVEARIRKSFDYAFAAEAANYGGGVPQLEMRRITTEPFEVLGARVIPLRLEHGRFRVLGFRFGDIAYCTDTNRIPPESKALLQGLDVLIVDALRHTPHVTHFSLDEAIETARELGAKQTYFTHMSHELDHEATNAALPAGMQLAYDGLRLPLGKF